MSKIYIFADNPESDAIKNAVKVISAACDCTVYTEKTSPASMLSVVVGLIRTGPYGAPALPPEPTTDAEPTTEPADLETDFEIPTDTEVESDSEKEDEKEDDSSEDHDDESSDDEITFNFESLGYVNVDGERIKAYKTNGESSLCVVGFGKSLNEAKTTDKLTYKLNESTFTIWTASSSPTTRVRINNSNIIDVKLAESKKGETYILINTEIFKR